MHANIVSAPKLALLALIASQFGALALPRTSLEQRSPPLNLGAAAAFGEIAHTTLTSTGKTV